MRKSILAMLLIGVGGNVAAEWTQVGATDTSTVYADAATINNSGNTAKMWHLLDFKVMQSRPYGLAYLSQKTQQEYDCKEARERTIEFQHYSENMGKGDVTHTSSELADWKPVLPGTSGESRWQLACGKR
jgi:hypothetical protein